MLNLKNFQQTVRSVLTGLKIGKYTATKIYNTNDGVVIRVETKRNIFVKREELIENFLKALGPDISEYHSIGWIFLDRSPEFKDVKSLDVIEKLLKEFVIPQFEDRITYSIDDGDTSYFNPRLIITPKNRVTEIRMYPTLNHYDSIRHNGQMKEALSLMTSSQLWDDATFTTVMCVLSLFEVFVENKYDCLDFMTVRELMHSGMSQNLSLTELNDEFIISNIHSTEVESSLTLEELYGKTITDISYFWLDDFEAFRIELNSNQNIVIHHVSDYAESVTLDKFDFEDGSLRSYIGATFAGFEERTSAEPLTPEDQRTSEELEYTFYAIKTSKGQIDLTFRGCSDYYSTAMSVSILNSRSFMERKAKDLARETILRQADPNYGKPKVEKEPIIKHKMLVKLQELKEMMEVAKAFEIVYTETGNFVLLVGGVRVADLSVQTPIDNILTMMGVSKETSTTYAWMFYTRIQTKDKIEEGFGFKFEFKDNKLNIVNLF